jgi:hypothetical protein
LLLTLRRSGFSRELLILPVSTKIVATKTKARDQSRSKMAASEHVRVTVLWKAGALRATHLQSVIAPQA